MKIEINNLDKKLLGEIAVLIAGTEATIKVIKDEIKKEEKPKEEPKKEIKEEPKKEIKEEIKATKPREKNAFDTGSYVPWQEQWEDMMTAMNWGRK